jgi:hypothetical protein
MANKSFETIFYFASYQGRFTLEKLDKYLPVMRELKKTPFINQTTQQREVKVNLDDGTCEVEEQRGEWAAEGGTEKIFIRVGPIQRYNLKALKEVL